jgi:creatinine amidohydrolase/Fe(II)-dependent formamide hydrolase-like protein
VATTSSRARTVRAAALLAAVLACAAPAWAAPGVELESMTWPELRERIAGGATTVLVPIGGTEQNGVHMALGKHNVRVRVLAEKIAAKLGNAVVAPVIAYVPEGAIEPPVAHMRWPGTISIPDATFEALLEAAARSFRRHGFRDIVLLGDHGGYQKQMQRVAAKLNQEWSAGAPVRVHALSEYYRVTQNEYVAALKARGYTAAEIGNHAGLADTSLALAVDPSLVRSPIARPAGNDGADGDPRRASAELGQVGIEQIVEASVAVIRERTRPR